MTKEQAKHIANLCIDVKPSVEDAFHFLYSLESSKPIKEVIEMPDEEADVYNAYRDVANKAGDRLVKLSYNERMDAIGKAYKMIDNVKKYGVACVAWMPD